MYFNFKNTSNTETFNPGYFRFDPHIMGWDIEGYDILMYDKDPKYYTDSKRIL